jgi:hypothetical protein
MFSISSRRAGEAAQQQPEPARAAVRHAAPMVKEPAPAVAAAPPAPAVDGEHRGAPRIPASAVPSITGLSLSPPGAQATLVNISMTGLLAECRVPLKTGTSIKVIFEGTFAPQTVEGRLVRTCVASMTSSGVRYNVAINFKAPIDLEGNVPSRSRADNSPATVAAPDPPQPSLIVNRW